MNVSKEGVYAAAYAYSQEKRVTVEERKKDVDYWNYLMTNYPFDQYGESAIDSGFTKEDVRNERRYAQQHYVQILLQQFSSGCDDIDLDNNSERCMTSQPDFDQVVIDVNNLLLEIQILMSDEEMTQKKMQTIYFKISSFMKMSGLPWNRSIVYANEFRRFVLQSWGEYGIPTNLEEAWNIIPMIGSEFKKKFDLQKWIEMHEMDVQRPQATYTQ
jgi:hypothetical protein